MNDKQDTEVLSKIATSAAKRGLPLERLLEWLEDEETLIVGGAIFPTFQAACKAFEVDSSYLYNVASDKGIPVLQLLQKKVDNQEIRKLPVEFEGEYYPSFSALCRAKGKEPQLIQSLASNRKIDRFKALEYAIEHDVGTKVRKRKGVTEIVEGIPYNSRKEVYRAYKVTSTKVLKFIDDNGCSFETAVLSLSKLRFKE